MVQENQQLKDQDEQELVGQSEAVYAHDGTLLSINDDGRHHMLTMQDEINQSNFLSNSIVSTSVVNVNQQAAPRNHTKNNQSAHASLIPGK